jgi:hypothetical protein
MQHEEVHASSGAAPKQQGDDEDETISDGDLLQLIRSRFHHWARHKTPSGEPAMDRADFARLVSLPVRAFVVLSSLYSAFFVRSSSSSRAHSSQHTTNYTHAL